MPPRGVAGRFPASRLAPAKAEAKDTASLSDALLQDGYDRALLGVRLLLLVQVISALRVAGSALGIRTLSAAGHWLAVFGQALGPLVPSLLVATATLRVLSGAASRNRLNGGTFRVLAFGLSSAFCIALYHNSFQLVSQLIGIAKGAEGLSALCSKSALLALGGVAAWIFSAVSVFWPAYSTLKVHGLPELKTSITSSGGNWPLTLAATSYALTAIHQVIWGGALILYSDLKGLGVLRCFVVAACAHVCQTAAVNGPKRLASETYRILNLALIVDSVARIAFVLGPAGGSPFLLIFPAISLCAASSGWLVGRLAMPKA